MTSLLPTNQRADGERGAIAVLFAFALTALVMAGALAIDVTNVSRSTRDLQGLADVISLDLSRYVDGRTHLEVDLPGGDLQAAWARVKADNGLDAGGARTASYTLGNWTNGAFIPSSGLDVPDAVRVQLDEFVQYGLGRVSGKEGQSLSRDAIASRVGRAQFTLGSVGASVSPAALADVNTLLGNLLGVGIPVGFDVASYDGLFSTEIDLDLLALELGFATPEELANATITAPDLLEASAEVVDPGGPVSTGCTSPAINNAPAAVRNAAQCPSITTYPAFPANEIFNFTDGTEGDALTTTVNYGALLAATIHLVNGSNFADVPGFTAGPPELTSTGSVQAVQSTSGMTAYARPGPPCEPDAGANGNMCSLETQQIDYTSTHTFTAPKALPSAIPLVASPAVPIQIVGGFGIRTQAARADATLTKVVCRHPNAIVDDQIDVSVNSIPLTHTVNMNIDIRLGTLVPDPLALSGTVIAQQHVPISINENAPSNVLNFLYRPFDPPTNEFTPDAGPKRSGNSVLDLSSQISATNLATSLTAAGLALIPAGQQDAVLAQIKNEVHGVMDPVLLEFERIAGDVLQQVGIHIGGADIWAESILCQNRTPTLVE